MLERKNEEEASNNKIYEYFNYKVKNFERKEEETPFELEEKEDINFDSIDFSDFNINPFNNDINENQTNNNKSKFEVNKSIYNKNEFKIEKSNDDIIKNIQKYQSFNNFSNFKPFSEEENLKKKQIEKNLKQSNNNTINKIIDSPQILLLKIFMEIIKV